MKTPHLLINEVFHIISLKFKILKASFSTADSELRTLGKISKLDSKNNTYYTIHKTHKHHFLSTILFLLVPSLMMVYINPAMAGNNNEKCGGTTWYVQFGGNDNASGTTKNKPFGSLRKVAAVSKVGDTIKILPGSAPLDGGIVLKDKQKLIGINSYDYDNTDDSLAEKPQITNSASAGNAVVLANNNEIKNIHIIFIGIPNDPTTKLVGSGIFGDNKTGTIIKHVKISKVNPINSAPLAPSLCQWIRVDRNNPLSAVDNNASTFRGCKLSTAPEPARSAAILLISGDNNKKTHPHFNHQIKDLEVVDARPGDLYLPTSTNKVWLAGIGTVDSGNVSITIDVKDANIRNTQWGFQNFVFDKATLILNLQNTTVADTFNDSIEYTTGFYCSGTPGDVGCSPEPTPVSDTTVVLNVKNHTSVYEIAAPAPGNSQSIEIVQNDINLGTHIVHVEGSSLVGYNIGFLYTNTSDPAQPKFSLFDLGCFNPNPAGTQKDIKACKKQGYTSKGLNRFIASDAQIEVLGSGVNVMAQNNYFNGMAVTPCNWPNNSDQYPGCLIDYDPQQNSSVDNRFFLLTDPAYNQ